MFQEGMIDESYYRNKISHGFDLDVVRTYKTLSAVRIYIINFRSYYAESTS